ncbi:hypothetical protein Tco_0670999 [Tanacetum coccineum]
MSSPYLIMNIVGSMIPLVKPLDIRKFESSSYQALGAFFNPYRAFLNRYAHLNYQSCSEEDSAISFFVPCVMFVEVVCLVGTELSVGEEDLLTREAPLLKNNILCGKVRNLSYDSQPERWDLPKDTSIVRYAVLRFDMNQLCHLEKRIDGAIQMSFESTLVPDVTSGNEEQASMVIYYIMLEDPILAGTPVKRFSNLPNHSGTVLILIHNDGAWCLPLSVKSGISLHMIMLILQKSFYNASKDSRIMKAQELKTKTSAQALIPNVGYLIITFTSY